MEETEKTKLIRLYAKRLREIQKYTDKESAHIDADMELVDLLNKLGFTTVTKEWEKVDKWYA